MANYTNIVNIVSDVRRARLEIPQTSCVINPWSLGFVFMSLQVSLHFFLHKMPEKRPHCLFEMINQLQQIIAINLLSRQIIL